MAEWTVTDIEKKTFAHQQRRSEMHSRKETATAEIVMHSHPIRWSVGNANAAKKKITKIATKSLR